MLARFIRKNSEWQAECLGMVMGLCLICGCGRDDVPANRPAVAKVIGTVRFKGEPLPNAQLTFYPRGAGDFGTALSEKNGQFTVSTYDRFDGAVLGFHNVTVEVFPEGPMVPGFEEEYRKKSPIPLKYMNRETTPLTVEVQKSGNNFDLEIKE
jgi:hypothetical protein